MNRRVFLSSLIAALAAAAPGHAQDYAGRLIAELRRDGYGEIVVSRTLLGRVRIVAGRNGGRREIVLNPNSGEILRDLWLVESRGENAGASGEVRRSGRSGGSDGSGSSGSSDDREDDDSSGSGSGGGSGGGDRDDDDDRDSSGSGSSGSGDDDRDDDRDGGGKGRGRGRGGDD